MTTWTAPKPLPYASSPTDRAAIAAGYRHLADLIESGQAPIPVNISVGLYVDYADWRTGEPEQPTKARNLMRALGGGKYAKGEFGGSLILRGMCGGLPVDVWIDRAAVCERVVVGEEKVKIPAQPARVEVREIVEWRCSPLLGAVNETTDVIEVAP